MLDTAGRLHIDEELMAEAPGRARYRRARMKRCSSPMR